MKKILSLAFCSALALAAVQGPARAADPIEIGVIANLTGSAVKTSVQMTRGVELAADAINAAGGIDGRPVKLIVEDSENRAQEALNAANKLYNVDKVPAAIMFGGSGLMIPVAELAKEKGRVLVNTSSSSPKLGNYPGTLFSILPLDDIVGKELGLLMADSGAKTAAIVVPNSTFGLGVAEAAAAAFEAKGGKIVKKVAFTEGQPDYRADIQPVVPAKPDVIITAGYGDDSRAMLKAARELGLTAKWYAAYPSILEIENKDFLDGKLFGVDNGGYSQPAGKAVADKYGAKFNGTADLMAHVYYGYDALMVVAAAIKKAGSAEPAAIAKALPDVVKAYDGATGKIAWDARGQRIAPPIDVIEYKAGDFVTTATRN
ncbi:ABC transporter substrate-binding protein [Ancylobacter defluvii]|uniref:Branched-chain amino acid ABC transporter substrate-binding protein n=1 Tax=Ancylobacter defluvii TaxID=1282440 RepID=A0A9W6JX72_9HYPH|nr:ABC transporter substrate-binding protein [Ancylobacter defluvii]MBS7585780.1 ABC transporter substrate-binding protein [Ancylobacter defluvii]GLK84153.1 branched-chain amino acid ABC transporter substrate-binding protein [Ancylobacter defluvii]